jgi:hypothetical protein
MSQTISAGLVRGAFSTGRVNDHLVPGEPGPIPDCMGRAIWDSAHYFINVSIR